MFEEDQRLSWGGRAIGFGLLFEILYQAGLFGRGNAGPPAPEPVPPPSIVPGQTISIKTTLPPTDQIGSVVLGKQLGVKQPSQVGSVAVTTETGTATTYFLPTMITSGGATLVGGVNAGTVVATVANVPGPNQVYSNFGTALSVGLAQAGATKAPSAGARFVKGVFDQ